MHYHNESYFLQWRCIIHLLDVEQTQPHMNSCSNSVRLYCKLNGHSNDEVIKMENALREIDRLSDRLRSLRPLNSGEVNRIREEFIIENVFNSNASTPSSTAMDVRVDWS